MKHYNVTTFSAANEIISGTELSTDSYYKGALSPSARCEMSPFASPPPSQ